MPITAHFVPAFRLIAFAGLALTFAGGSAVLILNQAQAHISAQPKVTRVDTARPRTAQIPLLTAKDFDIALFTPVGVTGKPTMADTSSIRVPSRHVVEPKAATIEVVDGSTGGATVIAVNATGLRSGPTASTSKVFVVGRGNSSVDVISTEGSWSQVRSSNGQVVWSWNEFPDG